jgi:hypothetical protein
MLEDALRYQTQGEDWVQRVGIGGVVSFLTFLLIPAFTLQGYMLEVMRRVMRGEIENPPEWGDVDIVDITVDGLRHFVVIVPYMLGLLLLTGIPFGIFAVVGVVADSGIMLFLGLAVGGLLYLVGLVAMAITVPVATANFVREDSITAGFDVGVLRTLVTNRTMLKAVGFGVIVNLVGNALSTVLLFTFVGILALPFVQFAVQSALFYIWATGFADAYEAEFGDRPVPTTDASESEDAGAPAGGAV